MGQVAVYPDFIDNRANCKDSDPELFTPARVASAEPAKALCRPCELREACLAWALQTRQPNGIWGGKTTPERQSILKRGRQK